MEIFAILHRWRKWIRFAVIILYAVVLVIAIPLCIVELEKQNAPDHIKAWFIGGVFVLLALPISLWGILQHIINYTTPHLQRHIIRILWMVPVYALNAWFALRFPAAAIYLDTLRECYEAYVVYNFMAYLMSFLNHEYPHLDIQVDNKPPVKHIFPLCCLPPCHNSRKFIQRCKHGVLQYTVVRPAMTVIALICEMFSKYNEGDFDFKTAWSYIVIINNLSQILAMYCLVLFYKAFKEELQPLKPLPKFLCVKAVVFLSFWQSLLIAALAKLGAIPTNGAWVFYHDIKEISTGLQDFLICIEMLIAAIAHYYSFSHKPFVDLAAEQQGCCAAFFSMWDIRDVTEDVREHARYIKHGMHKTLSRGKRLATGGSSERTPLLSGETSQPVNGDVGIQNLQNREPPTPAVILDADDAASLGADSMSGHRFDSFINKSTTSSMNNFVDFRPEENTQCDRNENLSRSVSLKGYDSSDDEREEKSGVSKSDSKAEALVTVTADVAPSRSGHSFNDHEFEHLDVHEDRPEHDGDQAHSSVVETRDGVDLSTNNVDLQAASEHLQSENSEDLVSEQSEGELQNATEKEDSSGKDEDVMHHSSLGSQDAEGQDDTSANKFDHDLESDNPVV